MLSFDLASLTAIEMEEAVVVHCSQFGIVTSVRVIAPTKRHGYAIAAVAMASVTEAEALLAGGPGDMKFGRNVIIRVMQEEKQIPAWLKRGADPGASLVARHQQQSAARSRRRKSNSNAELQPARPAELEILLVEDNPADVRMAREALRAAAVPHRLHVVEDGVDAIAFLCRMRQFDHAPEPDIILLDLNLPRVTGHEVLWEIKTDDSLKHIPVVVITSSKAQSDVDKSIAGHADYFMTKPAGLDAFAVEMKKVEALASC